MLNIFITGVDSNIGKTFIAAGLAATMQSLGYSTCVYKPVQTGAPKKDGFAQAPDLAFVKNIDPYIKIHSTYMLKMLASPAIAAEAEDIDINAHVIKKDYDTISKNQDCIISEGTGGIMTPLGPNFLVSDMVKALDLPIIIVVKPESGIINQTLLTINHAQAKGLKIRGIIINNFPKNTNNVDIKMLPRLIEEYSDAKIIGIVKSFYNTHKINPSELITNILNGIDIESVFDVEIAKLAVE